EADPRTVAEGRAVADCRALAVAATFVAVAPPVTILDSQPPSYSTAASRTQAAAPNPTAIRIAVSGFFGAMGVAASDSSLMGTTGSGTAGPSLLTAASPSHREGSRTA